ncbi:hypothetical protein NCS57_01159100 [Fusarium keratoplasticum]|uniref:Uncharacterized protein n=1 Tax=Fusarium keratoplasticum TaxID=1328300 RepID=A0ACC0QM30_9HYPO|nr:hypothetical protein NCS57_01159100 [Fusarium keratoplasticum]KAI8657798.1 hypothetical protein NCS57_01159100 [Fusarium keratoplasticum]
MPETWEISEMLANPKVIFANPKVNTSTFALEFAMRRRTQQQLLGLAQDAIDGLETQLEQNRRLTSIASRIKGQGTEWEDELKHRRQLRLILEIEQWVDRFSMLLRRRNAEIIPDIADNEKFINDSGELPAVLNDEDSSFTDQRISQLKGGA